MSDQNEYTVTSSWTAIEDGAAADITAGTWTIYNSETNRVYLHKSVSAPSAAFEGSLWIANHTAGAERAAKFTLGSEKLYAKTPDASLSVAVIPA